MDSPDPEGAGRARRRGAGGLRRPRPLEAGAAEAASHRYARRALHRGARAGSRRSARHGGRRHRLGSRRVSARRAHAGGHRQACGCRRSRRRRARSRAAPCRRPGRPGRRRAGAPARPGARAAPADLRRRRADAVPFARHARRPARRRPPHGGAALRRERPPRRQPGAGGAAHRDRRRRSRPGERHDGAEGRGIPVRLRSGGSVVHLPGGGRQRTRVTSVHGHGRRAAARQADRRRLRVPRAPRPGAADRGGRRRRLRAGGHESAPAHPGGSPDPIGHDDPRRGRRRRPVARVAHDTDRRVHPPAQRLVPRVAGGRRGAPERRGPGVLHPRARRSPAGCANPAAGRRPERDEPRGGRRPGARDRRLRHRASRPGVLRARAAARDAHGRPAPGDVGHGHGHDLPGRFGRSAGRSRVLLRPRTRRADREGLE